MIVECRDDRDYEAALAKMVEGGADAMILGSFALPNIEGLAAGCVPQTARKLSL